MSLMEAPYKHLVPNLNRQFSQTIFETRSEKCSGSVPSASEITVAVATPLVALLAAELPVHVAHVAGTLLG